MSTSRSLPYSFSPGWSLLKMTFTCSPESRVTFQRSMAWLLVAHGLTSTAATRAGRPR
jgi:hypothetical protein